MDTRVETTLSRVRTPRKNYWSSKFWQTPAPSRNIRVSFAAAQWGQLIPLHLNASRGNGQIYHANCHCGRDNMLNAAQAVSISLFRHTREAVGNSASFFSFFFFLSIPARLPSWHRHACRILIEGDANCFVSLPRPRV